MIWYQDAHAEVIGSVRSGCPRLAKIRSIRRSSPMVLTLRSLRALIKACFCAFGFEVLAGAMALKFGEREAEMKQPVPVENIENEARE